MLLTLLLATAVVTVTAKDSYVVLAPSSFRPAVPLNISINILNSSTPVSVTAELVANISGSTHKVAVASGSFTQGPPEILRIPVPANIKPGSYKLHVKGTGAGLQFRNETAIRYERKSVSLFIQTDKAKYKPGQTVNFRAFAVFPNLTVYTGPMDIDIYDANNNKIKQMRGLRADSGVITNYTLLDTQPVLGNWKIKVTSDNQSVEKTFEVAHYVLPKFEVTVQLPSFALTTDTTLSGTVKTKYTYGKPVNGTVTLRARLDYWYRPWNYHGDEPMVTQTFKINGEAKFDIPLTHIKKVVRYFSYRYIRVEANVTEDINKITLNGSSRVQFFNQAVKLEFLQSNPATFKPGLPYTGYVKVSQQDGTPMTGMRHKVNISTQVDFKLPMPATTPTPYYYQHYKTKYLPNQLYSIPDTGIVALQFNVPVNACNLYLHATYDSVAAYSSLSKSYSPSNNYIQLFLRSTHLQAGQMANFAIMATEVFSSAVYQVMSRGSVVSTGQITRTSFDILITDKMAPNARLIVYYVRADGEIVTDSISFDVDGAFLNQVSIDFDRAKAQPHENVSVIVTADPASTVNLLAVDQSVLLMKSGNDITSSQVITELKTYDTINSWYDWNYYGGLAPMADEAGRNKRMVWWGGPRYYGGSDAQQIFQNAGVLVMTDATVYHSDEVYGGPIYAMGMTNGAFPKGPSGGAIPNPNSSSHLKDVDNVRNYFPETWLWTNATTGADGRVNITTTVPDTITSWVASAFAVNNRTGLGVAPSTAKLEAFRPFFVSLNLPYSVIRGEQLALQANVFNYMAHDMTVLVTLDQSTDFKNVVFDSQGNIQYVSQQETHTVQIAAGKAKSVFFPIVPAVLGKAVITVKAQSTVAADAVQRQLLIEPEGVLKEYSNPVLIDLKNTTSFTKTIPLSLPAGVVAGSQRANVTAIGDLMGPTVHGLNNLLRMPYGCGEQNMVNFAPDVFITNYLAATNQLTSEVKAKATRFMEKGYQRELTYQHTDGSFSAFGERDFSGSMWLTAFVVKSFHQAKRHIFIDQEVIDRAMNWIIDHQAHDGHFPEPGHMHDTYMQGGAQSGSGLTAFVLIALLENNENGNALKQKINIAAAKAQAYLEVHVPTLTNDYVLAITTYALKLAGSNMFPTAFSKLNSRAIVKDGLKHWHKIQTKPTTRHYWRPYYMQSDPIDIEMTSYALLTYAVNNNFAEGIPIMKWVTNQRNSHGGFGSTQDTVVGLQALSDFVGKVYSSNFNIQASMSAGTFRHNFTISQQNSLVLQSVNLPTIPSQVTITASGHGFALIDVALSFHVESEIEDQSFDIQVTLVKETLDLLSIRTCSKWLLTGTSGMAVQEIGIPTGFEADLESIAGVTQIKRTETENRKVVLYFDAITASPICLTLDVIRTSMVAKSQPAAIRLYDYYQPSNQITAFYNSTLLQNSGICDVCAQCACQPASGK